MHRPTIKFKRLPNGEGLPLPKYATDGSAAMDICAAMDCIIDEYETRIIPTGFAVEVPDGWELQVRPRSGLAANNSVTVLNSPGTIDSDYRGEVKVIVSNLGCDSFDVCRGDRVAQIILKPAPKFDVVEVDDISTTRRGGGGLGSTGI